MKQALGAVALACVATSIQSTAANAQTADTAATQPEIGSTQPAGQIAPERPRASPAPSGQAESTAPQGVGLQDIIVTARKRSESIKNIPASIQAFSDRQLTNLNARSVQDLNGVTPNVRVDRSGSLSIRGISSNTRNIGFESGAAVYIDGVYQGRPAGNNQDLVDIERVELLRGPQGTLYGRNTTGGAISLVTARPGQELTGKFEAQYGERNDLRVSGFVAGPLTDDVGAKVSVFDRRSNGYQVNTATGQKYGLINTKGARSELRLTPGAWDIALRGDIIDDHSLLARNEPVVGFAVVPGRDTVAEHVRASEQTKGGGVSLTVDHDLGGGLTLTSITAQRWLHVIQSSDPEFTLRDIVDYIQDDDGHQFSQEVRLASPSSGRLTYVAGLYYFRQRLTSDRPLHFGADWTALTRLPSGFITNDVAVGTDAYAGFANADYHFTSKLTLNLGIRYTKEDKTLSFIQTNPNKVLPTYPNLNLNDKMNASDVSPTASLTFIASREVTVYAKYSKGFKAGGWNPDFTTTSKIDFDAEKVSNYEAGIKTQLLDNRLSINLSGYYMDYSDLQVSQLVSTALGFIITNAGRARVEGFELEMLARPRPWLDLSAGGAYNNAKYTRFDTGTGVSYAGQQFTNTPKLTAFVTTDVHFPVTSSTTAIFHADYRYQSKVFFNNQRTVAPIGVFGSNGYALVNLRAGIAFGKGLEASVFVDNLANKRPLLNRSTDNLGLGTITEFYGLPRQVGGRLTYKF